MIVKSGESRQEVYKSGTYDGIMVNAYIGHGTANQALAGTDFNPAAVTIKVLLKRRNQQYIPFQDNLLILGTFNSFKVGYDQFVNGIDKLYPSANVKALKVRAVKLKFGGHIRVNKDDELIVELQAAQVGLFSGNVDNNVSYIECWANPSIGYEEGIPQTISEVVQAGTTKQPFNPGDNIVKLMLLNFDKNDLSSEVVSNFSLQSDRLDLSLSLNQMLTRHINMFPDAPPYRFGTSLPISANQPSVLRGLDYLPQSWLIFDGIDDQQELDQVRCDVSFNGPNVAASQNYLVHTKVAASLDALVTSAKREQKHGLEKIAKLGG